MISSMKTMLNGMKTVTKTKKVGNNMNKSKTIKFALQGQDNYFIVEAPADITLEQLLKQCDKIEPEWGSSGIYTAEDTDTVGIKIGYDSIELLPISYDFCGKPIYENCTIKGQDEKSKQNDKDITD